MCVEALLVVWSDLSERAREFDSRLWKSLWVTLIAIGFVLVFKAQLSGAKFNGGTVRLNRTHASGFIVNPLYDSSILKFLAQAKSD